MTPQDTPSRNHRPPATLARSVRLLRLFRHEQRDRDAFYSTVAADSAAQVQSFVDVRGTLVVDVGGGSGYFDIAFQAAGARYVAVDIDIVNVTADAAIQGSGTALPIRSASADVVFSSNVIEHVAEPWLMADEMVRVTRPGGTIYIAVTLWWSPWGGHDTSPWHYLGGNYARSRYLRKFGREPVNKYGETLFAVRASTAIRWANRCRDAELIATYPRYYPRWLHWLIRVPIIREAVAWNLVLVLRKR